MKILHSIPVYAPAWQYGGPVQSVSRLCEGLVQAGIDVEVVTTNAGQCEIDPAALGHKQLVNGVSVRYFPVDSNTGPIKSRALVRELPKILNDFDLIHLSAIWQPLGISIQRIARSHKVPILHSLRGALSPYSFRQKPWKKYPYYFLKERPYLQRAAALHVTSSQELRELDRLQLSSPGVLLPNPMDLDKYKPSPVLRKSFRESLGIGYNTPLLLICGRQHHKKGLDLLPDVLKCLSNKCWHLLVVGSDEDGSGARFLQELSRLHLLERVSQRPTLSSAELAGAYNASDLLLLPSRHENFGNVVIEALACGCAVAISDRTGVAEDLNNDSPGDFGAVLSRDKDEWVDWLSLWLNSPQRAGQHASQWAASKYSKAAIATQAINIYSSILDQGAWQKNL